ncbi:MAG: MBL fold metallo-hydrolase, partial [Flavobacteriales bacterium]|nr:MBL fold metallo-hydrolase [Flavobacteriales bacterium]
MKDTYKTLMGELEICPMGHAGVFFHINDLNIYVDSYSETTDYSAMPKADILLITHEHFDHLDKIAVSCVLTTETKVISTQAVADEMDVDTVLSNGDKTTAHGIEITAVPA